MPQLETHTYASQIFWLLVTFIPLYLLLLRVVLPRIRDTLEDRQGRIDLDLAGAERLKDEALAARTAYEETLAGARADAQEALRAAGETAAAKLADSVRGQAEKLDADLSAAEKRIAGARSAAMANIRAMAADLAGETVARLAGGAAQSDVGAAVDAALSERG